jgi:hypothetical protein
MGNSERTTGEDIGRPGPWGEGRYQEPGQSVDESVRTSQGSVPNADKRSSTPVTLKDYESSETASTAKPESPPIKLPNPPDDTQPETSKVGSRDAPGG